MAPVSEAGENRTKGVNFRVTPSEFETIEGFIGGRNRSDVLRRLVLRSIRNGVDDDT